MFKLKKALSLFLASVLVLALAACGGGVSSSAPEASQPEASAPEESAPASSEPASGGEKVTVTFSMLALANEVDGWTAMIDEANKLLADKNVAIEIQKVPGTGWPEYYQKVITQMAGGNAPDIGRIAESYMPTMIEKGHVVDLTDFVSSDLDMSQYYEKTFENSAFKDGRYYGVPSGLNYYLLYYNKDLFDAAGLDYPSSDWTNANSFEEIRAMSQALTSGEGGEKQYGFSAGPYLAALGMFSTSIGGNNVFDAEGNPAVNDENTVKVLQWFDDMLRTDYSMPRPTDTTLMSAFDMFKAGRIGMVMDGTWWLGSLKDITEFEVGIAAVPAGNGGEAYTSQFVDSFVLFAGSAHPNEATEALKAIASTEGYTAVAATGVGGIPVVRSVANSVIENSLGSSVAETSKQAAMDAMDHTVKVPYNDYYEEADQKVNSVMDEWLLGRVTVQEYAEKIQGILEDYAARAEG